MSWSDADGDSVLHREMGGGPSSSIPPHLIPTPYLSTIFPSPFGPLPTGATLFHNAPPSVQLPQLFALTALSCALGPYQSHLLVGTETSQELPPARPALTLVAPRSVQVTELRLTVHTTREEVSQFVLRASSAADNSVASSAVPSTSKTTSGAVSAGGAAAGGGAWRPAKGHNRFASASSEEGGAGTSLALDDGESAESSAGTGGSSEQPMRIVVIHIYQFLQASNVVVAALLDLMRHGQLLASNGVVRRVLNVRCVIIVPQCMYGVVPLAVRECCIASTYLSQNAVTAAARFSSNDALRIPRNGSGSGDLVLHSSRVAGGGRASVLQQQATVQPPTVSSSTAGGGGGNLANRRRITVPDIVAPSPLVRGRPSSHHPSDAFHMQGTSSSFAAEDSTLMTPGPTTATSTMVGGGSTGLPHSGGVASSSAESMFAEDRFLEILPRYAPSAALTAPRLSAKVHQWVYVSTDTQRYLRHLLGVLRGSASTMSTGQSTCLHHKYQLFLMALKTLHTLLVGIGVSSSRKATSAFAPPPNNSSYESVSSVRTLFLTSTEVACLLLPLTAHLFTWEAPPVPPLEPTAFGSTVSPQPSSTLVHLNSNQTTTISATTTTNNNNNNAITAATATAAVSGAATVAGTGGVPPSSVSAASAAPVYPTTTLWDACMAMASYDQVAHRAVLASRSLHDSLRQQQQYQDPLTMSLLDSTMMMDLATARGGSIGVGGDGGKRRPYRTTESVPMGLGTTMIVLRELQPDSSIVLAEKKQQQSANLLNLEQCRHLLGMALRERSTPPPF